MSKSTSAFKAKIAIETIKGANWNRTKTKKKKEAIVAFNIT